MLQAGLSSALAANPCQHQHREQLHVLHPRDQETQHGHDVKLTTSSTRGRRGHVNVASLGLHEQGWPPFEALTNMMVFQPMADFVTKS